MTGNYGWAGRILWVDLTDRKISKVPTSDFAPEKYIGGVGLNSRIFWELGCPDVASMHPDSPILIAAGPLTGTSGPFTRGTICAIQPQSYPKELFAYSGFGSKFAAELKYAGYDALVVLGRADRPVILSVHDGDAAVEDAVDLWGLDTFETQTAVADRHPRASILTIGPAGETLSRVAIIINETSGAAGQGGYGAVMGSKNLKAIAVRGTGTVHIARPDDFIELVNLQAKENGPLSMREPLGGNYIKDEMRPYLKKFSGCYACPFQCHGVYDMDGVGKASQMCNDSWYGQRVPNASRGMWEGNVLSQRLGINSFELSGVMGFLWQAIPMGLVKTGDLGLSSFPLLAQSWEPGEADEEAHCRFIEELNYGIANGTSPLAEGLSRAAESLGQGAMDLCNAIYPAWGSRVHHVRCVGAALHWATDTRGPFDSCHDYNTFGYNTQIADHFGLTGGHLVGEREAKHQTLYEGSEEETIWVQHSQCVKNSLPACEFTAMPENLFHPPEMDIRTFESRILSAVTGIDYDADELWTAGERIWNLRRAIMVKREDRHRNDDTIDPAWFGEKHGIDIHQAKAVRGQVLGKPLDREKWESLKDRYYTLRGWDVATGRPTRATLEALDMKAVAVGLEKAGKLG